MSKKERVAVAMSGGVDSTVVAFLLLKAGYDVEGITLKLFKDENDSVVEAKKVCSQLSICHNFLDVESFFKRAVIDVFIQEYKRGLTPNPCVLCNESIKFDILYHTVIKRNFDFLATGHYAKVECDKRRYRLKRSDVYQRDQTYFLHSLKSAQLAHLLFPLGNFTHKAEVVEIAKKNNLLAKGKQESEGICFIKGNHYSDWLKDVLKGVALSGDIVDKNGKKIATHEGYYKFTIGQKKGVFYGMPKNYCVLDIIPKKNQVMVGPESLAYHSELVIDNVNWLEQPFSNRWYNVKMFNWGYELPAKYRFEEGRHIVSFKEPVRAVAKGQYAVFYDGLYVVGGGKIISPLSADVS